MILGPTAPTTAFELGAKTDDPVQMYLGRHLHHPGAARRAAGAVDSLRLRRARACRSGCRSWARYFAEARLLGAAHRYQQATDWHLRVPKETPL